MTTGNKVASGENSSFVTKERIEEYYGRLHPERGGLTVSELRDITRGWEAELYTYVVEYEEAGRRAREERVIRLFLGDHATQKATDEYKVISRLFEAGFPAPELFHLETDASLLGGPFTVMEYVRGRTLSEALHSVPEEEARSLMAGFTRIWVQLHRLDGASLFPGEFLQGDTRDYLEEIFARAKARIEETNISWLRPVIGWLEEHAADVTPVELSILHQDYHTENVLQREDGSLVVLDWTAAMAGDYRADLAWTMLLMSTYDDPALRDIILESYEEASGAEVRGIEYFEVLAMGRRLMDVSSSFAMGAEQVGLRAGALELMKESSDHLHKVYRLLVEKTGLKLPEFEALLSRLG
ncbi:MAG: phosphotransferase family protein [Candidatus Bathyarchaeota archaeon]|nr:MAG: phosphotransferase family protein [Candidatus Bathyarchaeota archaeon]